MLLSNEISIMKRIIVRTSMLLLLVHVSVIANNNGYNVPCFIASSPTSSSPSFPNSLTLPSKLNRGSPRRRNQQQILHSKRTNDVTTNSHNIPESTTQRRTFLSNIIIPPLLLTPFPASADDAVKLGTRVNQAVTQSDLGISVRKSIVRGAQVMDSVDRKWEQFSDTFGLGSERSRRPGRPQPKVVPDRLPLDREVASKFLLYADEVFVSLTPFTSEQLEDQISKTDDLVRKSFERSTQNFEKDAANLFNFECYVHFKAYNDLIVDLQRNKRDATFNFASFRKSFEQDLGNRLLNLLTTENIRKNDNMSLKAKLSTSLNTIKALLQRATSLGLVALTEINEIEDDRIEDWSQDLSDLQLSIPLDGDVTMNAQILLQEQGFRIYPDFIRFAVTSALREGLKGGGQEVTSDEYYMDTDYSSDPDKFEVKEVLLNIVIDSVS